MCRQTDRPTDWLMSGPEEPARHLAAARRIAGPDYYYYYYYYIILPLTDFMQTSPPAAPV